MAEYIVEPNCSDFGCGCEVNECIVRCKDCKRYVLDYEIDHDRKMCRRFSVGYDEPFFPGDDGFCAWGERMED